MFRTIIIFVNAIFNITKNVDSSAFKCISYSAGRKELCCTYNNGGTYTWCEVPTSVYFGLMEADSIGSYHYHNIRGKYPLKK